MNGKLFFVSFITKPRQNGSVIGAFLNALGILLGSLFGFARSEPVSPHLQTQFRTALGALTALCGLHLLWLSVGGSAFTVLKQLLVACLAMVLGSQLGRLLALQKISNRVGRYAAGLLVGAQTGAGVKPTDGFVAVTILFCAAPLGLVGAVTDGLGNYFLPLALKAVMDGMAMTTFVKMLRWPVALAAVPVFLFLNGLAVIIHLLVLPKLATPELVQAINAAAGLLICAMTLVILEVRRVELANYLPALFLAPILSRFLS